MLGLQLYCAYFVYSWLFRSSACFEHIPDIQRSIRSWWITVVLSNENLSLVIELLMYHMQIDFMLSFGEFKPDFENLHNLSEIKNWTVDLEIFIFGV